MEQGRVLALGSFDGLHIGHMKVIDTARDMAEEIGAIPSVCTFLQHPLKVLTGQAPDCVFEGEVLDEAFEMLGMETIRLDFAEIKHMSPEEFFNEILINRLNAKGVCVGFNYTFGAYGKGTPKDMEKLCNEAGIAFTMVPATMYGDEPISSTRIRAAIRAGDMELATAMLGRPFHFRQTVVDGDRRGRTWGFPTINQPYPKMLAVPKFGVYESRCMVDGKIYKGATNIGVRPTVKYNDRVSSETHIIDFDGYLYGKKVDVALVRFLRPEMKFDNVEDLIDQMSKDVETIKNS